MKINRQDTNGVKPLLAVGELGYDNYPSGGDIGRVYVGTGSSNIAQAKKSEVVTVDGKVDTHVARIDNPHGVTKAQVGLSNVDNTADSTKVVASAGKWTTGRIINGTTVDGTVNITTSQWGASRNVTIGNTLKTVNGSGDVSWTLTEIGAIGASSPAFTGVPTAPTAPVNNNSNQIATTAYVASQVANTAVALTGNQTVNEIKTFSSSPIVPTPTTDLQVANKAYVDQLVLTKDFLAKVKTNQPTSNGIFNGVKGINILGDSITHGAFALNSFNHSWGRIFQKMANVDLQSNSYGVINFLSLGSGATKTRDIHSVSFSGLWNASVNGLETLMGMALSNSSVGNEINITIPSFQSNANLNYIKSTTGGTFELYINGTLYSTTNTAGTLNPYALVAFPVIDNGKGQCNIKIKATVGTVEVSTIQYYKGSSPMVNLFATSGRKLRELTDNAIELICANSSTLIMALGHNDTYTPELVSRIDKLINECNANNIALVIPDFRWALGISDPVRQELIRLHQNVPGSIYIPFPELFKNNRGTVDSTYIVSTLSLWTDGSHPNQKGHKLIAETIAKVMNFSVTSKEVANYIHNYVMPLALNSSTTLENIGIVSSVKWDKSNIVVNCFVRMASSGAFPIGTHIIQTAWSSDYEIPQIRQNWQGVAFVRNDTGAIVSIASLNSAGEIKLYVLSSFITNQSFEFSVSVQ